MAGVLWLWSSPPGGNQQCARGRLRMIQTIILLYSNARILPSAWWMECYVLGLAGPGETTVCWGLARDVIDYHPPIQQCQDYAVDLINEVLCLRSSWIRGESTVCWGQAGGDIDYHPHIQQRWDAAVCLMHGVLCLWSNQARAESTVC